MKKFLFIALLFLCIDLFPQAQYYFPAQAGYKWNYKVSPLDSLNNKVDSLTFCQADTFATSGFYHGVDANILLSKSGNASLLPFLPYTDSSFINLSGNDASVYFRATDFDSLTILLDSLLGDSLFPGGLSLFDLFNSFEGWYTIYKFANPVNASYQIFRFDTTITYDSLELPLRFELKGKRLNDEQLETAIGAFNCKKFIITAGISYLVIPPWPFPVIPIPLLTINDTVHIAPDNWEVKHFMPSSTLDLSYLGWGSFTFPGMLKEIVSEITYTNDEQVKPEYFNLELNYPNPFNPVTNIIYQLPKESHITLKVYDLLGNEVAVLVDEIKSAGRYKVTFNASHLASGIYLYKLQAGYYYKVHKMNLIK